MDRYLNFIASTNLKNLLGRDLVTDQIAAIFELVKNSYDADARKVKISFVNMLSDSPRIVIHDNGSGMSLDDIEHKWMVIGTDSKKHELYSPIFKRPLNGDKGIGRFSVDRLGSKLTLESVERNSEKLVKMNFDWNLFEENYQNVSDVKINYDITGVDKHISGVRLQISDLRDEWNKEKLRDLVKNLRQFKSPFAFDDKFSMIIDAPDFGYDNYEIQAEKLDSISSLWIDLETRKDDEDLVYAVIYKDGIEYEEVFENKHKFGPVKIKMYFFNQGDKVRFHNRFAMRVREFGNIRLYRDEFRIHPYGEENNDWLDVDRRHAQGFARTFGSRDLIGYVQTYKEYNVGLVPLTNRQGLIDNNDYNELRKYITEYAISTLERYYFQKFKKNKNESLEKSKKEIEQSTKNLETIAKEVAKIDKDLGNSMKTALGTIKKEQKEQLQYANDQKELTKVYSRIAQKESFLHQLIHQVLLDIKAANLATEQLEESDEFFCSGTASDIFAILKDSVNAGMTKLITVRDDVTRTRHKIRINMKDAIEDYITSLNPQLRKYNICLESQLDSNVVCMMDKSDFIAIINNIVSNSIKALREIEGRERKIFIQLKKTERYFLIKIKDNGIGINEHIRERIFDPFFTTTQKYGGFGLGLTIVDEMLKEYNGTLELVEIDEPGACFIIKIRR